MGEVDRGLAGEWGSIRMVPIHAIRAELRRQLPGMTDQQLNDQLLDMRRQGKVRLVSITDRSRATEQQLRDSVFSVGETFFYVERVR